MWVRTFWPRWPGRFATSSISREEAGSATGSAIVRNKICRFLRNKGRGCGRLVEEPMENLGAVESDGEWVASIMPISWTWLGRIRDRFEPPTWSAFEEVWLHDRASNEVACDLALPIEVVYLAKSRVLSGCARS